MSEQNKFTPGPWEFQNGGSSWDILAGGELLADTIDASKQSLDNARLIAASPELYEALESAIPSMEDVLRLNSVRFDKKSHDRVNAFALKLEAARAALAKARG